MTIKEAFGRQPQPRPTEAAHIVDRQREYKEIQLLKGIAVLEEAGIPSMLGELLEAVKLNHLDARLPAEPEEIRHHRRRSQEREDEDGNIYRRFGDGSVHISLGWNYREEEERYRGKRQIWDEVTVTAEPLTQTLFISGKECEKITKNLWSSEEGRIILEDAIVEASRTPGKGSPPMHI